MKKLMMIAALAVSGVALADACGLGDTVDCAEVYDVALSVKTTVCKLKYTPAKSDKCGLSTQEVCDCYRDVASVKINGEIWSCTCSCTGDQGIDDSALKAQYVLLDPATMKTTDAYPKDGQIFWIKKQKAYLNNLMTFTHVLKIGKKAQKVELAGTFGPLTFAGFGDVSTRNGAYYVKKASGGVAGLWTATPDCTNKFTTPSDDPEFGWCLAWKFCDDVDADQDATVVTPAYGSWTLKFNSSKAKALAKTIAAVKGKVVPAAVWTYKPTVAYTAE